MSQPLPRFTQSKTETDPLEIMLAQRQAKEDAARQAITQGTRLPADPADLRGIPCIARGVGGTSPGTNPLTHILQMDNIRRPRYPTSAGDGTRP